jgi:DNA-directed RNA polymerase subunit RPC12/RpoP
MPISYLDRMLHTFRCMQCGHRFQKALRSLLSENEIYCPECGSAQDIRESKRNGEIGKLIDTAEQLDKRQRA